MTERTLKCTGLEYLQSMYILTYSIVHTRIVQYIYIDAFIYALILYIYTVCYTVQVIILNYGPLSLGILYFVVSLRQESIFSRL